jgi:excisionase family DNA binding protein
MGASGKTIPDFTGQIMTANEVAELLRVHKSTIYRLLKAGKLPSFRMGTDYRFSRQAIDEWRKAQEVQSALPSPPSRRGKPRNG